MISHEIKSLLEEIFFEEEYQISGGKNIGATFGIIEHPFIGCHGGRENFSRFYVKVYSEKLKHHTPMIRIENYVTENIIREDVWEMIWTLPDQNYYMKIPVGDPKAFLMISKEKLKDILLIQKLKDNLISDMTNMRQKPIELIRDFKLNNLV
jgi:hypothetical protein